MRADWTRLLLASGLIMSLSACGIKDFFAADTYEAPPEPLVEFEMAFEPDTVWSEKTGGNENTYGKLNPWLQGELILTVDDNGMVSAFDAVNGKRRWREKLDMPVVSGVGGNGSDRVYVGSQDGQLVALDAQSGEILWETKLTSEVLAAPDANQEYVVVRTADGRVHALAAGDGQRVWNYQRSVPLLSLRGVSAPKIVDNTVIAGFDNGKLVSLDINDGRVIWEKSVAIPSGRTELERLVDVDADPVIVNNTVYAAAFQGEVAAFALQDGRQQWSREMSVETGIAVSPGEAVYLTDSESYVWAVQDGSGDSLWRQTRLLRRSASAPVIAGDYIVVGDFEGYLHWIAREDGRFVARQRIDKSPIRAQPLVRDGLLYALSADGKLTAVRIPE